MFHAPCLVWSQGCSCMTCYVSVGWELWILRLGLQNTFAFESDNKEQSHCIILQWANFYYKIFMLTIGIQIKRKGKAYGIHFLFAGEGKAERKMYNLTLLLLFSSRLSHFTAKLTKSRVNPNIFWNFQFFKHHRIAETFIAGFPSSLHSNSTL